MHGHRTLLTVAASGTTSAALSPDGASLIGLIVPALDSTTIGFEVSPDGITWTTVKTNSGAAAAVTLGDADTGSKAVAVPEEVGRLAAVLHMRLVVASQTGGARTITAVMQRR